MQIGNLTWASSWISLSIGLAMLASTFGPGPIDSIDEPTLMVLIDGGPFTMGAEDLSADERPVHVVQLDAFEIDRLPVTNAQFAAFLNAIGRADGDDGPYFDFDDSGGKVWRVAERYAPSSGYEHHPVVSETWRGARAYCTWRGGRLPTEAEWERAARGASGRTYPWGEDLPSAYRARYGFRLSEYMPVGSYPEGATPEGVLDMAGNVWQWTSTRYSPYPYRPDDGREDPANSNGRVVRGGSHNSSAEMLRSSFRGIGQVLPVGPISGRPTIGFRCARDLPEAPTS